jgi:hypothetical protein
MPALNITANQKLTLAENNCKTGSCLVLFTWNGVRFVCVGEFLGRGGLGYLVAPGVCCQPDRDETVAIRAEELRMEPELRPSYVWLLQERRSIHCDQRYH